MAKPSIVENLLSSVKAKSNELSNAEKMAAESTKFNEAFAERAEQFHANCGKLIFRAMQEGRFEFIESINATSAYYYRRGSEKFRMRNPFERAEYFFGSVPFTHLKTDKIEIPDTQGDEAPVFSLRAYRFRPYRSYGDKSHVSVLVPDPTRAMHVVEFYAEDEKASAVETINVGYEIHRGVVKYMFDHHRGSFGIHEAERPTILGQLTEANTLLAAALAGNEIKSV
jgi:hypothetical protein